MKTPLLALAVLASAHTAPALALTSSDLIPFAEVTATGIVDRLETIDDGVFTANGGHWENQVSWYSSAVDIIFDLGGSFVLESAVLNVDNNDDYSLFGSVDGLSWIPLLTVDRAEGSVAFGMETFTRAITSTDAFAFARLSAVGDNQFAAGEVQLWGVAAVPEPATYAMMLAGLGLLGGLARRRAN